MYVRTGVLSINVGFGIGLLVDYYSIYESLG